MFDFDVVTGPSCFPTPAPRTAPPQPVEEQPEKERGTMDSLSESGGRPSRITPM